MTNFDVLQGNSGGIIKAWRHGVQFEDAAIEQLKNIAGLPFVWPHVAAMPDTHFGMGATVGSVIPTQGAVIPAAVGVDIGCGMMAVRTNLDYSSVHDGYKDPWLEEVFKSISKAVPHGRTDNGGQGDRGSWHDVPQDITELWNDNFARCMGTVFDRHPDAMHKNPIRQLGTLGTGNHFIEVCREIDNPNSHLWVVIHSGSRGFGNKIGSYFTKLAKQMCERYFVQLPDPNLGYLPAGTQEYKDYVDAVDIAQRYAWLNREIMMGRVLKAIGAEKDSCLPSNLKDERQLVPALIHMHHNYVQEERHFGKNVLLTRKGAVDATENKWVIIPGSMGAKTYLGVGLGNRESFHSCSHGAGRAMSRTAARKNLTLEQHIAATSGVVCDKTTETLDETPAAYKDIDAVMAAQSDLVKPILTLRQIVCVKGLS